MILFVQSFSDSIKPNLLPFQYLITVQTMCHSSHVAIHPPVQRRNISLIYNTAPTWESNPDVDIDTQTQTNKPVEL